MSELKIRLSSGEWQSVAISPDAGPAPGGRLHLKQPNGLWHRHVYPIGYVLDFPQHLLHLRRSSGFEPVLWMMGNPSTWYTFNAFAGGNWLQNPTYRLIRFDGSTPITPKIAYTDPSELYGGDPSQFYPTVAFDPTVLDNALVDANTGETTEYLRAMSTKQWLRAQVIGSYPLTGFHFPHRLMHTQIISHTTVDLAFIRRHLPAPVADVSGAIITFTGLWQTIAKAPFPAPYGTPLRIAGEPEFDTSTVTVHLGESGAIPILPQTLTGDSRYAVLYGGELVQTANLIGETFSLTQQELAAIHGIELASWTCAPSNTNVVYWDGLGVELQVTNDNVITAQRYVSREELLSVDHLDFTLYTDQVPEPPSRLSGTQETGPVWEVGADILSLSVLII